MAHTVQRVAHRGGSHLAPENTLAAFRNALTMPIDAIELDVQMSHDGEIIVFHDNVVDRITDGTGNLLDLDFAYLRSLNAATHFPGGWPQPEQIPTLREVLDLARGRVRVYIEVKLSQRDGVYGRYPKIADRVVTEVRAARMLDQVFFISFDWPILTKIKSLDPSLQVGALVSHEAWSSQAEHALEDLCKKVSSLGCNWIHMDRKLFTPAMPAVIHQRGLKLGIWTVNTGDDLHYLADATVDSLTTDRPDLFSDR